MSHLLKRRRCGCQSAAAGGKDPTPVRKPSSVRGLRANDCCTNNVGHERRLMKRRCALVISVFQSLLSFL